MDLSEKLQHFFSSLFFFFFFPSCKGHLCVSSCAAPAATEALLSVCWICVEVCAGCVFERSLWNSRSGGAVRGGGGSGRGEGSLVP